MVAVRAQPCRTHRHEDLRRIGSTQRTSEKVWIHSGGDYRSRPGNVDEEGCEERMKISIGSDHAGFPLKQEVIAHLRGEGHEVVDLGTNNTDPVDYPDY